MYSVYRNLRGMNLVDDVGEGLIWCSAYLSLGDVIHVAGDILKLYPQLCAFLLHPMVVEEICRNINDSKNKCM